MMMHTKLRLMIPASVLLVCSMASAQGLPKKSAKAKAKTAVQKAVVAPVLTPDAVPENTEPSTQIFQKGNSFQFNTDDDAKTKAQSGGFNFSVPGSAAEEANRETADPVNMIINDNPYKVVVGYPRWDLSLAYAPINVSFTQKLSNPVFEPTSSLTSLSAFSLLGRLNPSLDTFFELEYSRCFRCIWSDFVGQRIEIDSR
jgi:hypothetical protein